jgi:hypothetical protein
MRSLTEGFTGWCDSEERPAVVELGVEHVEA